MKKAFFVSNALLICCLMLSLSPTVTAQISATNYTAPSTEQTRTEQAPLTRSRKEWDSVRAVRLNELTAAEKQANQNAPGKKALRIGIARQLPRQIESLNDFTSQSTAQGTLYLLRIISPGAKSLRLHFKSLQLPAGAHLFVSSLPTGRQNAQVFSPAYTDKRAEFWTPSLPGEEVIIECFVPSKAAIEKAVAPFQIDAVNHIFRAPRESNSAQIESAGACNQEVPAEFSEAAKATALIAFSKPDGEYVCSGTLMADIKKTGTPYFLTANHCISNGGEAASAEVYWNYNSGPEPTTTPTRGAQLLATDQADDFSLLQLGAKPPGGVVYSGWTAAPQAVGTSVTGIHHPQADYKRASFGKVVEASCIPEIPAEFCDFYAKVRWDRGITEGGSSGSGIFIGTGNQTQLVGILSGGESECNNQAGADYYGRMSRIFGAFGYYLTNEGICRYTLLNDQFMFGQTGGNGEFTVVPKIGGENCPWQARSNVSWITFTNAEGNSFGKVTFQVAANTSNKQRIGAITIAGRNVLVRQNPAAPNDPCAATQIDYGQTVAGDLRTSNCPSHFDPDPTVKAARYTFDAVAGQSVTFSFRQTPFNSQMRLIYPDGKVVFFRDSYPTILPLAGKYTIELALVPSELTNPVPYNFFIVKNCQFKYSNNYVEADAFGASMNPATGTFPRISMERVGDNCFNLFATADEPIVDEGKLGSAPYDPAAKELILAMNASTDTKLRYIVIRIQDQPFIIKQIPRCSSATTFSYTPSQLNPPGTGGTFQMQVKRTAGPSCSWEVKPYERTQQGDGETRDILIQPENYSNWARGTDDGNITYKVPINSYFRTRNYLLKNGDQVAQTITQPFLGETCARPVLQVGQSANGTLATTDCNWYEAGQYVDVYQLNLAVGEQYAVELSGTAGSEITAELGILEYGSNGTVGDLKQKAVVRSPETGFGVAYVSGTYALRVFGKPGSYQIKLLGVGPPGCVYKINKEGDIVVLADTTSFPVQLECNRGDCDWTAQSSANWITFANGASGRGNQTLNLTLAPNTGAKRQATVTIAGRVFNLTQDHSCSYRKYSTAAPNKLYASYEGGEYNYYVETGATCAAPTMTPGANWITASAPFPSVVKVNITANTGGFRKGTLKIAGEDFEVFQGGNDLVVTTAADYQRTVAPGSLVTLFNEGMTAISEAAQSLPLPSTLANASVLLELPDKTNVFAPLLFATPSQINFYLPESVPTGKIKIKLASGAVPYGSQGSGYYGTGEFDVANIAPNVFTAAATGRGPAAAEIQRIRPGQPVIYEPTFGTGIDEQGKPIAIARPITIGTGDERTFLVLYATGVRKRIPNAAVTAQIGDVTLPVEYAGAQGQFVGLDQINIQLPPSLRGKGLVNVTVTIDGKTTNPVQINIAP